MAETTEPAASTSELRFGFATAADLDAVVALVESAYRGDSSRAGWTTEADHIEGQRIDDTMVQELLDRPDAVVLTVRLGDELVACCELDDRSAEGDAYLGMFAVKPTLQGGGVGRAVLAEAERIARGWGARRVVMTVVDIRHELVEWYGRRGYLSTGQTVPFPYGDERYGRPTRPDLRFVVLAKDLL